MKQIDYVFFGNFDRDLIDDELMDIFMVFDNPHKDQNRYIVYGEFDKIPEISDYAKSFLVSREDKTINDDWKTKYKDAVKPFEYKNIFVRTPWMEVKKNYNNVIINPALAFGTGDHETTMICSKNIIDFSGKKDIMFDVGTGSGILSFIAVNSGFKKAIGFDIDDLAINSAIENRDLNNISLDKVELYATTIDDEKFQNKSYDLIVANMISSLLKTVIPQLIDMMYENTTLILSGILDKEEQMMNEYLSNFNVDIIGKDTLNEWILFKVAKR